MAFQATLLDLMEAAGPLPRKHLEGTSLRSITLRQGQKRFLFLAQSQETYSAPEGHVVSLLYPNLVAFDKLRFYPRLNPLNQRVRVFCSCPAWRWWGSAALSTSENYRLPEKKYEEMRPADVRDPLAENFVCKHVLRAGQRLSTMTFKGLLTEARSPKTSAHAKADADSLEQPVADFMVRHGYAAPQIDAFLSQGTPDILEDAMAEIGMVCGIEPGDEEPGEWPED